MCAYVGMRGGGCICKSMSRKMNLNESERAYEQEHVNMIVSSAVLKEFFEGILYHYKRNHKQLSRGVGV